MIRDFIMTLSWHSCQAITRGWRFHWDRSSLSHEIFDHTSIASFNDVFIYETMLWCYILKVTMSFQCQFDVVFLVTAICAITLSTGTNLSENNLLCHIDFLTQIFILINKSEYKLNSRWSRLRSRYCIIPLCILWYFLCSPPTKIQQLFLVILLTCKC